MFENSDAVSFATNGTATYHYPNPDHRTIGPFGSGATLKTDGEKIVGRVEAPAFRVGGVYRQQNGVVVRLEARADSETAQAERVEVEAKFRTSGGARRLSDGRYVFEAANAEYECHLLPGELVQRDGQWVAMEEAPRGRLTGVVVTVGGQSHGFASGTTVTILGGGGSGGSPNTPMLSRDDRQPTARERQVMARINLAKSLAADWEAAKKQPALAHPYPFARNFQG